MQYGLYSAWFSSAFLLSAVRLLCWRLTTEIFSEYFDGGETIWKIYCKKCRDDRGFQEPSKDWAWRSKGDQQYSFRTSNRTKNTPRKIIDRTSILWLQCSVLLFSGEMLLLKSSNENISKFWAKVWIIEVLQCSIMTILCGAHHG